MPSRRRRRALRAGPAVEAQLTIAPPPLLQASRGIWWRMQCHTPVRFSAYHAVPVVDAAVCSVLADLVRAAALNAASRRPKVATTCSTAAATEASSATLVATAVASKPPFAHNRVSLEATSFMSAAMAPPALAGERPPPPGRSRCCTLTRRPCAVFAARPCLDAGPRSGALPDWFARRRANIYTADHASGPAQWNVELSCSNPRKPKAFRQSREIEPAVTSFHHCGPTERVRRLLGSLAQNGAAPSRKRGQENTTTGEVRR